MSSKVKISQPQPIAMPVWMIALAVVLLFAGMVMSAVVAYWFVGGF